MQRFCENGDAIRSELGIDPFSTGQHTMQILDGNDRLLAEASYEVTR